MGEPALSNSTNEQTERKQTLQEFCKETIYEKLARNDVHFTGENLQDAYRYILNNDDNLIVEICHDYNIQFDNDKTKMMEITEDEDVRQLQTMLLHLLIGHYFDISEEFLGEYGKHSEQEHKCDPQLRNFFIWSLFAPTKDVKVQTKLDVDENHKCCHKCALTSPSTDTPTASSESESVDDMAMLIFDKLEEQDKIFSALFAAALLKELSRKSVDEKESLREFSKKFSNKAIDLIRFQYDRNEKNARRMLKDENEIWGNMSILKLAVYSKNLDFLHEPVCRTLLQEEWMGHLSSTMSVKMTCLCLLMLLGPIFGATYKQPAKDRLKREKIEWRKNLNTWTKMRYFFKAPIVRFLIHGLTYIVFLGYFSYVLLIQFRSEWTNDDYILITFMSLIFVEELLQFLKESCIKKSSGKYTVACKAMPDIKFPMYIRVLRRKVTTWLLAARGLWFIITVVSSILFYVGYGLKSNSIDAARIVLGFDLILLHFRSLHIFSIHKQLGPKILMIGHMFKDLCYFILILLVFVVSYGMAAHSIMYPNSELNIEFVLNLLKRAYWNIYGELLIEELEQKEPSCTFDEKLYSTDTLPRCPTYISTVWIPIMMGFYILVSNILLLNLLIAMFSSTFNKIEENSGRLWNYQRYFLIRQYKTRFWTPFALVYVIFRCIKYCCKGILRCCCENKVNHNDDKDDKAEDQKQKKNVHVQFHEPNGDGKSTTSPGQSDNQTTGTGNSSNNQESHA